MLFGKRRNYLINKEFQLQFIALLVFAAMLASIQLIAAVLILDSNVEQEAASYGLTADPVVLSFIIIKHKEMLIQVFTFVGVTVVLLAAFGLYFSHRIAGPIYKINKFLTELTRDGNIDATLKLRKSDQFREVADTINLLLERLRGQREEQVVALNKLRDQLAGNGGDKASLDLIDQISNKLQLEAMPDQPSDQAH